MKMSDWNKCPLVILEPFIDNLDLEYDPYESSHVEAVNSLLYGDGSVHNERIVTVAWNQVSQEDFQRMCNNAKNRLKDQLAIVEQYITK